MKSERRHFSLYLVILCCYMLATQVYPFIHFHTHSGEEGLNLTVCVHPVDLENFHHVGENDDHAHRHFLGDDVYLQSDGKKIFSTVIAQTIPPQKENSRPKGKGILARRPSHGPPNIFLKSKNFNKAPPQFA